MEKLTIIKIGGNIIEDEAQLANFVRLFSRLDAPKILVHGGGRRASQICEKLGIAPQMVEGRRITDKATMEVVTMVYAGLLNKRIVAQLQAQNCSAIGLSGADGNAILAHKRPAGKVDYGFAGDVDWVNAPLISNFLEMKLAPVFCAISHDKQGDLLNTNADTIATEIAIALSGVYQTELTYIFEKQGVLEDVNNEASIITELNQANYEQLKAENKIFEGMIPKLDNAFSALEKGVSVVRIGSVEYLGSPDVICTRMSL